MWKVYRLRLGYSDVKNTGYSLSYNNTDISFAADGTATVTTYQLDGNGNKQLDADGNPITTTTTVNPDANGQYSITDSTGTALTLQIQRIKTTFRAIMKLPLMQQQVKC